MSRPRADPSQPATAAPDAMLFPELTGARFSDCGLYRYTLWRTWDAARPPATFLMLNPSTADHVANDPTVERCQRRAQAMGYGGLRVVNIFALRSTDPASLYTVTDPVGPGNDAAILEMVAGAGVVICAWGTHGALNGRDAAVRTLLHKAGVVPYCLGTTAKGHPRHPLYVAYTQVPVLY